LPIFDSNIFDAVIFDCGATAPTVTVSQGNVWGTTKKRHLTPATYQLIKTYLETKLQG
jgi:hypothetical protein